jgi:hypothetical protein
MRKQANNGQSSNYSKTTRSRVAMNVNLSYDYRTIRLIPRDDEWVDNLK